MSEKGEINSRTNNQIKCSKLMELLEGIKKLGSKTLDHSVDAKYYDVGWVKGYKILNDVIYKFDFKKHEVTKKTFSCIYLLDQDLIPDIDTLRNLIKRISNDIHQVKEIHRNNNSNKSNELFYFVIPAQIFEACYLVLLRVDPSESILDFQTVLISEALLQEANNRFEKNNAPENLTSLKEDKKQSFFYALHKLGKDEIDFEQIFNREALAEIFFKKVNTFIKKQLSSLSVTGLPNNNSLEKKIERVSRNLFALFQFHSLAQAHLFYNENKSFLEEFKTLSFSYTFVNNESYNIDIFEIINQIANQYKIRLSEELVNIISNRFYLDSKLLDELINLLDDWETIIFDTLLPGKPLFGTEILGYLYENFLPNDVRSKLGIYYTPPNYVDEITLRVIEHKFKDINDICKSKILIYKKNEDLKKDINYWNVVINELLDLKILDPTVGSGSFLVAAIEHLSNLFLNIYDSLYSQVLIKELSTRMDLKEEIIKKNPDFYLRAYLLANALYGVDLRKDVVQLAIIRLYLILYRYIDNNISTDIMDWVLEQLNKNIIGGKNSLLGLNFQEITDSNINEINEIEKTIKQDEFLTLRAFTGVLSASELKELKKKDIYIHWKRVFPAVAVKKGFDIILGNPPYTKINDEIEKKIVKARFKIAKKTKVLTTEKLFVEKSLELLNDEGAFALILPKSLLYIKDWFAVRELILSHYLMGISDLKKAFKNVKLEQVAIWVEKRNKIHGYPNQIIDLYNHRRKLEWIPSFFRNERFVLVRKDIQDLVRIFHEENHFSRLGDHIIVRSGLSLNNKIITDPTGENTIPALRGRDISSHHIKNIAYLPKDLVHDFKPNNKQILVQRIIAHINNPYPHLKIMAVLNYENAVPVNTITIFTAKNPKHSYLLVGLLNSRFVSWYAYHFIYCEAIRSMDFRSGYVEDIKIPWNEKIEDNNVLLSIQNLVEHYYDKIIPEQKKEDSLFRENELSYYSNLVQLIIDYLIFSKHLLSILPEKYFEIISKSLSQLEKQIDSLISIKLPLNKNEIDSFLKENIGKNKEALKLLKKYVTTFERELDNFLFY